MMKSQTNKNTPRNFGNYPLLEIINFLNINQQIVMINYNKKLRERILSYCKVLKHFLSLWYKIKTCKKVNFNLLFQRTNDIFSNLEEILLNNIIEDSIEVKSQLEIISIRKFLDRFISNSVLNLGKVKVSDNVMRIISNSFKFSYLYDDTDFSKNKIYTLVLDGFEISPNGFKLLSKSQETNSFIKTVEWSKNKNKPERFKLLAEGLKNNSILQNINLSDNKIHGYECRSLAGIMMIGSLLSLDLSGNKIGHSYFSLFFSNEYLTNYMLLHPLTNEDDLTEYSGCKYLKKGLEYNTSLLNINLSDNCLYSKGIKYLAEALISILLYLILI